MLVGADPEAGAGRAPGRSPGAGTGRPVTQVAGAVAALDRERQAHPPRERRQQPVGQPEMAVGLDQHERDARAPAASPTGPAT